MKRVFLFVILFWCILSRIGYSANSHLHAGEIHRNPPEVNPFAVQHGDKNEALGHKKDFVWVSPADIHLAALHGDRNEIERILKEDPSKVNAKDGYNYTPIYYAIHEGNPEIVKMLISKGADLTVKCCDDSTPLLYTLHFSNLASVDCKKRVEIFRLLVENGADIRAKNSYGSSVIDYVIEIWDPHQDELSKPYLEILISHNIDVNEKNKFNQTPLHTAALYDNVPAAKILVKHGADVNARNDSGITPLHYAAASGFNMLKYLISLKATLELRTDDGKTPLVYALHRGIEDLLSDNHDFQKESREKETEGMLLTRKLFRERVNLLVDSGVAVNVQDKDCKTPLHYAVEMNDEVIIRKLLSAGANKTIQDRRGFTPVDYAVKTRKQYLIDALK